MHTIKFPANTASPWSDVQENSDISLLEPDDEDTSELTPTELTPEDVFGLLADVEAFVRRYVILTNDQAAAISLWVLHTHTIAAADVTPYLHIHSVVPGTGKSRLLEVLSLLVRNPWFTGRTTTAALARKIEQRPTLLLDESDVAFNKPADGYAQDLRGILNSGYRRSGKSTICTGRGANNWTPKDFPTFCPKAIAGIGQLPDTVADRSIPIAMRPKRKDESIERFKERIASEAAKNIRSALQRASGPLVRQLQDVEVPDLEYLHDRAAEVWEPLMALATLAGDAWRVRAEDAARNLMKRRQVMENSAAIQLLADIRDTFRAEGNPAVMFTQRLIAGLKGRGDGAWNLLTPKRLADELKPFDIFPTNHRIGKDVFKGYRRASFEDAWSRYLPSEPLQRNNVNVFGPEL